MAKTLRGQSLFVCIGPEKPQWGVANYVYIYIHLHYDYNMTTCFIQDDKNKIQGEKAHLEKEN